MEVYKIDLEKVRDYFWKKLKEIDIDPDTEDDDVLAELMVQREAIEAIEALGIKVNQE